MYTEDTEASSSVVLATNKNQRKLLATSSGLTDKNKKLQSLQSSPYMKKPDAVIPANQQTCLCNLLTFV